MILPATEKRKIRKAVSPSVPIPFITSGLEPTSMPSKSRRAQIIKVIIRGKKLRFRLQSIRPRMIPPAITAKIVSISTLSFYVNN